MKSQSIVGLALLVQHPGYEIDDRIIGFESQHQERIVCVFSTASKVALKPNLPPIHRVP